MSTMSTMDTIDDLLTTHAQAAYPPGLTDADEVDGVALVLLDADIVGLATAFRDGGGRLRPDQWHVLRECVADTRTVLPHLAGEAWVYFARLHALARAVLRAAPSADAR